MTQKFSFRKFILKKIKYEFYLTHSGWNNSDFLWCDDVKSLSRVQLFMTPWALAYQAPPSTGFCRQEYWSGLHFLLQGIFPTQGSNLGLPHYRQMLYHLSNQGSKLVFYNSPPFLTLKSISLIILESLISIIGVSWIQNCIRIPGSFTVSNLLEIGRKLAFNSEPSPHP